jgi:predicted HicB family RNase H-like nuclease
MKVARPLRRVIFLSGNICAKVVKHDIHRIMKKLMAIRINPETWRQLKVAAARTGVTIGDYIAELLKKEGAGQNER